ncbi:MAG: prepilin-type N-terminal cleavage/methylation domain-containing protein [Candidatus Omnitrophota bacterium]|nr:prepilin-type N-terminal cleavage/methylation domain-containing protein [Candidatus Omnitrophota bacterium]MBU1929418.1 prepilin-type N-terminal cleavage/methylation domain-containing protein [Candidatus Omnitrophota bacterium]MBU2034897.1 prepilin-type N-terminal cleavage/methylation domain-containing protein [Candidatus Omnitrophota bacterium]MBU2221301.1 prepilin-type N-terminal cleavage/methylation domain-containing protein [Candidatus Omnitrophota bacterium]MBU2257961.1 prepilin-type N-
MKIKGFTLLELMIVIIIIGVMSTISVISYFSSKERVANKEAITSLKMLNAAEKGYKVETYSYYPSTGSVDNIISINNYLSVGLSNNANRNWNYKVFSNGCVQARRNGGDQRYFNLTINYGGEPDSINNLCP